MANKDSISRGLMGRPGVQNDTTCPYFGDITVNKDDRSCKICEFASPELREMQHESVDPDLDLRLKVLSANNVENNTFV